MTRPYGPILYDKDGIVCYKNIRGNVYCKGAICKPGTGMGWEKVELKDLPSETHNEIMKEIL